MAANPQGAGQRSALVSAQSGCQILVAEMLVTEGMQGSRGFRSGRGLSNDHSHRHARYEVRRVPKSST